MAEGKEMWECGNRDPYCPQLAALSLFCCVTLAGYVFSYLVTYEVTPHDLPYDTISHCIVSCRIVSCLVCQGVISNLGGSARPDPARRDGRERGREEEGAV